MNKIRTAIIIVAVSAVICAAQIHLSGPLSGILDDTTYVVDDNISVNQGDSLLIEPGAVLSFPSRASFQIYGYLSAAGTENDTIKFIPLIDTWEGLNYAESADDSNKLHYCLVTGSANTGVTIEGSRLSLQNTVIQYNYAENGGGIRLENATVTVVGSSIRENIAEHYGGGINASGSTLNMTTSEVSNNRAIQAGGIYLHGSILYMTVSSIESNEASTYDGGGVYATENSFFNLNECSFHANFSEDEGGGIFAGWGTSAIVQNCDFTNNWSNSVAAFAAESGGNYILIQGCEFLENDGYMCGGINFATGSCWIDNCLFNDNFSTTGASAVRTWDNDTFEIDNCTFTDNRSINGAGAVLFNNDNPVVSNTLFQDNTSEEGCGAVYFFQSEGQVENCQIIGNRSLNDNGGGIKLHSSDTDVILCHISENEASVYGGGIYISGDGYPAIDRCTVSGNESGLHGGGIYNYNNLSSVYNTIVSLNINEGVWFGEYGDLSFSFSDIFGNQGGDLAGNIPDLLGNLISVNANGDSCDIYHNILLDPLFADPLNGNFNLLGLSPCIDAGASTSPLDPDGTIADIGAFYFNQAVVPIVEDLVISIVGNEVILQWSEVPGAQYYKIYRSDQPYFDISGMTAVGLVFSPIYGDTGAATGGPWFYAVTVEY